MEFVIDTSFAVDCKARALYSEEVFLTYTAFRSRKAEKFIDKFERDNEVKLKKKKEKSETESY